MRSCTEHPMRLGATGRAVVESRVQTLERKRRSGLYRPGVARTQIDTNAQLPLGHAYRHVRILRSPRLPTNGVEVHRPVRTLKRDPEHAPHTPRSLIEDGTHQSPPLEPEARR